MSSGLGREFPGWLLLRLGVFTLVGGGWLLPGGLRACCARPRPGGRGGSAPGREPAARGACALRSSSGLGVPTAFNRAGEEPRARGRGELPFVIRRGGPRRRDGLAPPRGMAWGFADPAPLCGVSPRLRGDRVLVAELARGDARVPAGCPRCRVPLPHRQPARCRCPRSSEAPLQRRGVLPRSVRHR